MSKGAPKQRASAQELLQAKQATEKDARYEAAFRPLEKAAIDELDSSNLGDRTALLAGRAAADVGQQSAGLEKARAGAAAASGRGIGGGAAVAQGFEQSNTVARAGSKAVSESGTTAQTSLDADTLNVIRTGQNVSRTGQSALTASARLANDKAASILSAQTLKDNAKGQAIGEVVKAGFAGHIAASGDASRTGQTPEGMGPPTKESTYAIPTDELGFYSKFLRAKR